MGLIQTLSDLDRELLLYLNSHHSPLFDTLMIWVTGRFIWIPFYILIAALIIYKYRQNWWLILLVIGALIASSDLFASALLKPLMERPRPCHEPSLSLILNMPNGCGGKFGFISSHAANTFALATFTWLLFRKISKWFALMFVWAAVVSYSRIYLGVHYPGDIIGGMLAGMFWATLFYNLFKQINKRWFVKSE